MTSANVLKCRPLTLDELTDAINYDPGLQHYNRLSEMTKHRSTISKELICKKLGTLLDVHKKDKPDRPDEDTNDYVFFNHLSIRDFFHEHENNPLSSC